LIASAGAPPDQLPILPGVQLDVMGAADDVWMIHAARDTPMTAERETTLTITLTYETLIPQRLEVITGEFPPLIGVYRIQLPRRVQ